MLIDSIIPKNNDCISHRIIEEGQSPTKQFTAIFTYEDGSRRSFDGKNWKVITPSRKARLSGLNGAFAHYLEDYTQTNAPEFNNF